MKKLFSTALVATLSLAMVPVPAMGRPQGAIVTGMVSTLEGKPAPGLKIVAKDPAARVIGEALSDARGRYALLNVPPARYQLTLDPLNSPYKGQTVVSAVGSDGLTVNWMVSQVTAALATATPGPNQPSTFQFESHTTGALIFLGGSGLISGLLAGAGAFGSRGSTASGSQ